MRRPIIHLLAAVLLLGCGTSGGVEGPGENTVGHEDEPRDDPKLSVEEAALSATVEGGELRVTIPIRTGDGGAEGRATVTLLDLEGRELGEGSASFRVGVSGGEVEVALPADGLPEAGAPEVERVVHWQVKAGSARARGYRSLFQMLPKMDVRARMPSRLVVGADAKVRVFALDAFTGRPRAGVPVTLRLEPAEDAPEAAEAVEVQGTTGDEGSAVLDLPGQAEGEYTAKASAGQGAYAAAVAESDVAVQRSHRVLVTTDKPVYQPGQTMNIRALVLKKPALDADGEQEITLEILDGKGNMVFRKYETTDEFGVAGTTFKLATQVNMGHYQIKAHVGGTTTTKTVTVERYALPKFALEVEPNRDFYLAGGTLRAKVEARYFFGEPVAGGAVDVKAITRDVETTEFAHVTGSTDADGRFEFDLALPEYLVGQPLETGNALVALQVQVTDTAGHERLEELPVVVSSDPVDLVAVPESGAIVPGLDNVIYVFATDPLGRPLDAEMAVTVGGEERSVEALGEGVGRFVATPEGALSFRVDAATSDGASASEDFTFQPGEDQEGLLLRTDASLYRVGDTATVQVFTTAVGGRVFLDVIKDGQTALTDAADIVDGVATFALDLDGGLAGDVVIEAYRVGTDAAISRDKKMVFVQDAKSLDIQLRPDKPGDSGEPYGPGEEATLEFTVTDEAGEPVVAALGIQIVDEAVYHVTEMKPGLLETYFLIQEELREPSYQIDGVRFDMASTVTGDPGDTVSQVRAEASFAALGDAGLAGETSSWSQVRDAVPGLLRPAFEARLEEIEANLAARAEAGAFEEDAELEAFLAEQGSYFDHWGQRYVFQPEKRWDGWYATVTSAGPDEELDTWDDLSGEILVRRDHDDRFWDEDGQFAGGPPNAAPGARPEAPGAPDRADSGGDDGPRVRQDFPETLFFEPSLITDAQGKASVTLNMADSITEWRVSTLANTKAGALGSAVDQVPVFQPFFVDIDFPATLTRNDELSFPVAVYNYLPVAQQVDIELEPADWFQLQGSATATVNVAPGEVTSVLFPVKVETVGEHALTVVGIGSEMSDAVRRVVEVVPDGTEERAAEGGVLDGTSHHEITYPGDLIPHSHDLLVKIYPGIMAQAVEGLDSLLQKPTGCFEQTTASNWPNTLVLDYLKKSGQASPEVELKALDFLQQGYQRLLTFEVTGGGFVWFGDPSPANAILSAMGVMEFSDMAEVIEVDEDVIRRTAEWLEGDQHGDGHWSVDRGSEFATVQYDDVKTTAYIAWALAESAYGAHAVSDALTYLTPHVADSSTDVYALALMANAFAHGDPSGGTTQHVLQRLADEAVVDEDGSVYWEYGGSSYNYGGPEVGGVNGTSIEVTALAIQAFIATNAHVDLVEGAIAFLAGNKDSFGNWGTTHATILSLRAMVMSLQNKAEEGEGTVMIDVNGAPAATLEITDENRNVFHQFELGDLVSVGDLNDVTIDYEGTGRLMYQVVSSWWTPSDPSPPPSSGAVAIDVSYDKTKLEVSDTAVGTATVTNRTEATLSMVMIDLGVPPGFDVLADALAEAVDARTIMKYELAGQQISIYLEEMAPGETVEVSWGLRARFPVKAQSKPAAAYLYYDTDNRSESPPVEFTVQ